MNRIPSTDDESFIRAIVDAPGDDARRLVYADWLDQKGDPRGAYLRREVEAFRQTLRAQPLTPAPAAGPVLAAVRSLHQAGRRLDPVWVARVSRPPVGPEDLRTLEAEYEVTLPAEYKALLLNQNGGHPYPNEFVLPGARGRARAACVDTFAAIAPRGGMPDGYRGATPMFGVFTEPDAQIDRYVAIAADGADGVAFLATVGPVAGAVIYNDDWTHTALLDDAYEVVANSLPEFLASLFTSDPEWAQHIVRNDMAKLRAWLDAGGDPNTVERENDLTPLMNAVIYERLDMIHELIARGAQVTPDLRQASAYHGNREIAALIDAALRPGR